VTELPDTPENRAFVEELVKAEAESRLRYELACRRDYYRWQREEPCDKCGEWVGHFGGSVDRDPCPLIPQDVPLEEVRENRYAVRRYRMADAVRAAAKS
jgi:hypothetical protein